MENKKLKIISMILALVLLLSSFGMINVSAASAGVTINKTHYSVQIGSTVQIGYSGTGIIWTSSDTSVATVSQTGVVKGVSMGKATITAKSGSYTASCEITCGFYKGIDVSSWNGDYSTGNYMPVDWAKVKAQGIDFAILRAGYGWEDYPDQRDYQLVNNIKGCVENDIPFGLYFYAYAYDENTAILEANYLLKILREYVPEYMDDITLPIAYDLEEDFMYTMDTTKFTNIALAFCKKIQAAGFDTMIYGNSATFNNMHLDQLQANDIGFWYAMWPNSPNFSEPETIGKTDIVPEMWQYASDGTVSGAGYTGGVDMNVLYMLSVTGADYFEDTKTTAKVTTQGANTATVSWGAVSGASYNLYRAQLTSDGRINTTNATKVYSGSKTTYTDKSIPYGTAVYYYTNTVYTGDMLDPNYKKEVSGVENGAYVYNVLNGDVTLDKEINLIDAIKIQKYVNKMISFSEIQKYAADYNNTSSVYLNDAIAVQKATLNM